MKKLRAITLCLLLVFTALPVLADGTMENPVVGPGTIENPVTSEGTMENPLTSIVNGIVVVINLLG